MDTRFQEHGYGFADEPKHGFIAESEIHVWGFQDEPKTWGW